MIYDYLLNVNMNSHVAHIVEMERSLCCFERGLPQDVILITQQAFIRKKVPAMKTAIAILRQACSIENTLIIISKEDALLDT